MTTQQHFSNGRLLAANILEEATREWPLTNEGRFCAMRSATMPNGNAVLYRLEAFGSYIERKYNATIILPTK